MQKHHKTAFLFLAPFLTVFIAFYLAPVVYAIYLSLFIRKRVGIGPAKEVFGGLANYFRAIQDGDFLNGLKNMFVFGVVQVPVMLGLAILLALLLAESRGVFMKVCRTAFFMPYGIPSAIGALIWGYFYSPNLSPFNQVLAALHAGTIEFLSPATVLFSIANIVTWTWTGYNMITLFAALQNIPNELYEAARVDGATKWDIVRSIKIPLLMPTLKLLFIFSVIGTSQLFT
jgi:multiple sugar transport system permease protein